MRLKIIRTTLKAIVNKTAWMDRKLGAKSNDSFRVLFNQCLGLGATKPWHTVIRTNWPHPKLLLHHHGVFVSCSFCVIIMIVLLLFVVLTIFNIAQGVSQVSNLCYSYMYIPAFMLNYYKQKKASLFF